MMSTPFVYYQKEKEKYDAALIDATRKINGAVRLRLWLAVIVIVAGIYSFRTGIAWQSWLTAATLAAFVIVVRRHIALQHEKDILDINLSLVENELKWLQGDISPFPAGESYISSIHPFSYDLDIFGKGSVYQLLCRAGTSGGAAALAGRLQSLTMSEASVIERQQIIKDLSTQPSFLRAFRVAGAAVPEGPKDLFRVKNWLQGPDAFVNNTLLRVAVWVMPVLSAACIIWSLLTLSVFPGISLVVIINWLLLAGFRKKVNLAVQQIGNSAPLIDKYAGMLSVMASATLTTPWLQAASRHAKASLAEILHFKKLVHLFDSHSNGMVGPLMNTLFLFDFYCLLRLESWRKKHGGLLLKAIDEMIDADVYVSCSVYAFNCPGNTYPVINTQSNEIKAADLKHPLLPPEIAVGNDTSIGRTEQFYLLTGANMTGKSTFIRTIGVSNVMTNLGLPLPAGVISLPLLELYTSMRITDSVQDDISYFRAELNRIKAIMDKVSNADQHYLVLLDEPLRGTNSADKQQGTRAIVEKLLSCKAIGIVATHDTGLCDMEDTYAAQVRNYHFESTVGENGLSFDFRLRPGASTSNNATILMRQMGIIK